MLANVQITELINLSKQFRIRQEVALVAVDHDEKWRVVRYVVDQKVGWKIEGAVIFYFNDRDPSALFIHMATISAGIKLADKKGPGCLTVAPKPTAGPCGRPAICRTLRHHMRNHSRNSTQRSGWNWLDAFKDIARLLVIGMS